MALATASSSKFNFPSDSVLHIYRGTNDKNLVDYLIRSHRRIFNAMNDCNIKTIDYDKRFTTMENIFSMTMKKVQEMSINIMCENIEKKIEQYGIDPKKTYLAMSGGFGLNCPTNSFLVNKYGFKGFIGPPCQNDSGQALGIGLYNFYKRMNKFKFNLTHAYYGYYDHQANSAILGNEFNNFIESVEELSYEKAVKDICEEPIVWFNGRAEIGPRALGNRSLLGDSRKEQTKDMLNQVKDRQWWRPVAPVILAEDLETWFEDAKSSPFMLHTFKIRDEKIKEIPAVAHIDTSARVQTVTREDNKVLYDLITAYKKKTGVPILCNTSLNDKGEPIINTAREALNFALRKKIKVVYINMKRITLKNFSNYNVIKPLMRDYEQYCSTIKKARDYMNDENGILRIY